MFKVDKVGFVSMQLQGLQLVDEVLIRALTAGVRRSAGDALGFDWAPGNLAKPEGMKAGWQQRSTAQ